MSLMNLFSQLFEGGGQGGAQGWQEFAARQGYQLDAGQFCEKYHAYSPAYWDSQNREQLDRGDKIVLPPSALEKLSRLPVKFPIMFEIKHESEIFPRKSHCSVLEFTAPEGTVYMPLWMLDNLGLDRWGDSVVQLKTVKLQKGHLVQFQAHETKFAMLSNPKVVLEKALRSYSCLTLGDTIQIEFATHVYRLDVTQVVPESSTHAISIIETDLSVDFKEPKDYKEWSATENHKTNSLKNGWSRSDQKNGECKEDEEDDKDWIVDPAKALSQSKANYFQDLEANGCNAQKVRSGLRKKKSKRSNKSPKNSKNKSNSNSSSSSSSSSSSNSSSASVSFGKSQRGVPLGMSSNAKNSYSCQLAAKKGSNSNNNNNNKMQRVEEIVGNMRYIYEIDSCGNRKVIRRLPLRNLIGGQAKSLK